MTVGRKYKKVFTTSRFRTTGQNSFPLDSKNKRLTIGQRNTGDARAIYLGKVFEHAKAGNIIDFDVYADVSFPHVVGIFGSRGSGKSFDLGVIVEGIFLPEDQGPVSDAGILFDVQDQFWTLAHEPNSKVLQDVEHLSELDQWGLEKAAIQSINVWVPQCSDTEVPEAQEFCIASEQLTFADWLSILELEQFSPMGQALLTLLKDVGFQTPDVLAQNCVDRGVLSSYQQGTIDGLRWRLESLNETQIVADSGLEIDELLRPNSLSVILMRNLSDAIRGLIVGVVARLAADRMGRIQQSRKVALRKGNKEIVDEGITNRLWMILDEAHVLVPSDGTTAASAPLVDYVKRGRDAGLSLIFATQQPSAVSSRLLSQVDLTITHMLGFDADLSAAVARMPTRSSLKYEVDHVQAPSLAEVIRSLRPGEAVIADGASSRAFLARIRPRLSAHGGATPK